MPRIPYGWTWSCFIVLAALQVSCFSVQPSGGRFATLTATDGCPKDNNEIIQLDPGVQVEIIQQLVPADQSLPADSPAGKKLNLSYVKVRTGLHVGEYCWASTANLRE